MHGPTHAALDVAHSFEAGFDHTSDKSPPPRVQHRHCSGSGDDHRRTIGREDGGDRTRRFRLRDRRPLQGRLTRRLRPRSGRPRAPGARARVVRRRSPRPLPTRLCWLATGSGSSPTPRRKVQRVVGRRANATSATRERDEPPATSSGRVGQHLDPVDRVAHKSCGSAIPQVSPSVGQR